MYASSVTVQDDAEARRRRRALDRGIHGAVSGELSHASFERYG